MTKLRAKVVLEGELVALTGLHVGSAAAGVQIGSIDSPVVRDPITNRPYIPGSSFKGKLRSLLESVAEIRDEDRLNRQGGGGGEGVKRHECDTKEDAQGCPVCRLFGSTGKGRDNREGSNYPSRLMVCDLLLTGDSFDELKLIDTGLMYTEWKFENALDRVTSAANPRQIERVPKGSAFEFRLIYDDREDVDKVNEDMQNLSRTLDLLEDDALGGHGSRGYGRVTFEKLRRSHRPVEQYGTGEGFSNESLSSIAELARAYERV